MGSTYIFDPTAPMQVVPQQQRRALNTVSGMVVGFIDNAKPNFNYLVDDLADILISKYGVASVLKRGKVAASIPAPEAVIREVSDQCGLVITGSGD